MAWWLDMIWFCIKSTFQLNFWENQILVRSLASLWKDGASTDFSSQSCWRILWSLRAQATVKQVAKANGKAFYCIKRRVLARYVDIDLIWFNLVILRKIDIKTEICVFLPTHPTAASQQQSGRWETPERSKCLQPPKVRIIRHCHSIAWHQLHKSWLSQGHVNSVYQELEASAICVWNNLLSCADAMQLPVDRLWLWVHHTRLARSFDSSSPAKRASQHMRDLHSCRFAILSLHSSCPRQVW